MNIVNKTNKLNTNFLNNKSPKNEDFMISGDYDISLSNSPNKLDKQLEKIMDQQQQQTHDDDFEDLLNDIENENRHLNNSPDMITKKGQQLSRQEAPQNNSAMKPKNSIDQMRPIIQKSAYIANEENATSHGKQDTYYQYSNRSPTELGYGNDKSESFGGLGVSYANLLDPQSKMENHLYPIDWMDKKKNPPLISQTIDHQTNESLEFDPRPIKVESSKRLVKQEAFDDVYSQNLEHQIEADIKIQSRNEQRANESDAVLDDLDELF